MHNPDPARTASASPLAPAGGGKRRDLSPLLPLLLLETLRDADRPEEVLEDEDLTVSLPRRLGLSDVVLLQINRLQDEARRRQPQRPELVADLLRLVSRRPDAEDVFTEAGRRLGRQAWEQRTGATQRAIRLLPTSLALAAAQRAVRRLFRELVGPARLQVQRRPPELRITRSLTATADPRGAACALYAGAFAELLRLYTSRPYVTKHTRCEARGDLVCEGAVVGPG
jgi:predicted hydrocarbon binding protein